MARYEVFSNQNGDGYLLEVQADLLDELATRVVVPLVPSSAATRALRRLTPVFPIGGNQYALSTHLIATFPAASLGEPRASLAGLREQIDAALEMLFAGF